MKGRKPKPGAIRVAQGDRGAVVPKIVEPMGAEMDAPEWLGPIGRDRFTALVAQQRHAGILDARDWGLLVSAAWVLEQLHGFAHTVRAESQIFTTEQGQVQLHAACSGALRVIKEYRALAGELGLSPVARQRIAQPICDAADDFAEFE